MLTNRCTVIVGDLNNSDTASSSALTCCTWRAREALDLILIPPKTSSDSNAKPIPAIKFFDQLEIYPSSKIRHFKKLHEKTGIPYDEMVSRLTLCTGVVVMYVWLAVLRRRTEESGSRRTWCVNLRIDETRLDWRQVYQAWHSRLSQMVSMTEF